nr:immunoglobulin light chain junction region [Macaca mulatta]
CMQAPQTPYSF